MIIWRIFGTKRFRIGLFFSHSTNLSPKMFQTIPARHSITAGRMILSLSKRTILTKEIWTTIGELFNFRSSQQLHYHNRGVNNWAVHRNTPTLEKIQNKMPNLKEDTKCQIHFFESCIDGMGRTLAIFDEEPFRDAANDLEKSWSTVDDWKILTDHFEDHRSLKNTTKELYYGRDADVDKQGFGDTQTTRGHRKRSRADLPGNGNHNRLRISSVASGTSSSGDDRTYQQHRRETETTDIFNTQTFRSRQTPLQLRKSETRNCWNRIHTKTRKPSEKK